MRIIYHLVVPEFWEQTEAAPYRAASLDLEGFIHCSNANQVARVANLFYGAESALLVLCIEVERLTCPLKDENPGINELFPHVYGPIPREAIRDVRRMQRDAAGLWAFPAEMP